MSYKSLLNEVITLDEAAERLGVSSEGLYDAMSNNAVPCKRRRGRLIVRLSDAMEGVVNEYRSLLQLHLHDWVRKDRVGGEHRAHLPAPNEKVAGMLR